MSPAIKKYRVKNNISLGLPVNYKNQWASRWPAIIPMIQDGVPLRLIAPIYNCTKEALSNAMKHHGHRTVDIRYKHKKELARLSA